MTLRSSPKAATAVLTCILDRIHQLETLPFSGRHVPELRRSKIREKRRKLDALLSLRLLEITRLSRYAATCRKRKVLRPVPPRARGP